MERGRSVSGGGSGRGEGGGCASNEERVYKIRRGKRVSDGEGRGGGG